MESQKRPSLHLLTDVAAASAAGAGPSGSGSGAAAEMSPTSGFLPDMPQWKKDLIQRRKTNVARTQAASITSPTDGSCGALASAEAAAASGAIAETPMEPATISSTSQKRNMNSSEEKSEKSSISNTNSTGGHHSVVAVSLSPEAATTTTVTPIPKQRSSLRLNTRSQEKETEVLNESGETEKERESEPEPPAVVGSRCGDVETGTIGAASSSSANQNSSPNQHHLKTKCKPGQSVAEGEPSAKETTIDSKSCKTKTISDKLQSNKFIIQQQQQQQQQLSPTKVTVKPTMVAMQEMKKTTKQNGQHRHLAGKIGSGSVATGDVDPPNPIPDSLDTGEDLSYGPGIVSKLRCRYLSLALRESHQQSSKQRLQRSTSLNTLLDRDDDEVEVEEPEVASQVRAKSTPPPILGAKPTSKPGQQRPVSLGSSNGRSAVNPPLTSDGDQPGVIANGGGAGSGVGSGNRSRHFKRGNEVMKRARSVEALLCEKSPWNSQRITIAAAAAPAPPVLKATPSPVTSPTCVTIEDKIHNARERLHSGTDTAPPKRLTSIIDDTERPPPDLVKQTLKMFEASANRRPRTTHRSNGVGGVASKVASYKSIIKDQKPATATPPGIGFASSTPLRTPHHAHPDIIPRQTDSPVSALSVMMRRMELQDPEALERERDTEATPQSEAPSETERNDRDEGDGEGEGDDDSHNNNDDDGDSSDNNEQRDKMGAVAANDKPKPPTETAAGGAQRSFADSTENAHVASGSSSTSVRKLNNNESSGPAVTKQIGVIRPLFNSQGAGSTPLTSREIEKNRINEMKKSTATEAGGAGSGSGMGTGTGSGSSPTTSLDTVINTKETPSSETEASASPLWTLRKLRNQSHGAGGAGGGSGPSSSHHSTENTSMVFNFSKSTKEVPDYIESDVVIYRRKRELPKPNEPGFVLLGDLSVETSTDTDCDDYSMCPPSPCDVEFENANIVIDGKSSIRQKPKESTFRVQFNDTLTSTFEYPSEASMVIEDPPYADPFGHLLAEQMHLLQHQQQLELEQMHQLELQQQHHHVTVDEIIELPTSTAGHGLGLGHRAGAAGGGTMLGNLPLGSTALGFYTPVKGSPMDNLFQLGVTRYALPESSSSGSSNGSHSPSSNGSSPAGAAGSRLLFNGNGSIVGIGESLIKEDDLGTDTAAAGAGAGASKKSSAADEDDYHLTATPGAGVVYSEGTQKTDLLY
uniref:Uncharacterized protein LOC108041100 isoform X1 n=1 Tax=Drosophila rhopaloa TaxID=1041015 RepID=A0A6P4E8M8_DRORH